MNRRERRIAAKRGIRLDNMSHNKLQIVIFDITPTTIDNLPDIISKCIKSRSMLRVFSSEGDHTNLELSEMPHVKELFLKACIDYGLLEFFSANRNVYPLNEAIENLMEVAIISIGTIKEKTSTGPIHNVDTRILTQIREISRNKYNELYVNI